MPGRGADPATQERGTSEGAARHSPVLLALRNTAQPRHPFSFLEQLLLSSKYSFQFLNFT